MDIDLGSELTYKVKFGAQTYSMREPTFADVKKFQAMQSQDEVEAFMAFVSNLGLPRDVAEGMGVSKLRILSEKLAGEPGKK